MAQQAQVEHSPPASPLLPAASSGAAEPVLKSPADALLQAVVLQHFAVMKQQSDACRQLLARFQERSRMTLPPDNQSQWLVDRMNADPSMTSATREVDDVEMVLLALLDSSGQLSVPARVDGFFALMCRVQKMDHMVLLLTVLESHSTEVCRQRFLLAGGLKVLQQWLHNAREGDNVDLMTFILRVTAQLPFNKDSVKESGIGKTIKKLTRYTNDSRDVSSLVDLANEVVQSWKTELEKAKQNGANPTAETKAPLAPLPRLVYQVDAKLAAAREATLRSAVGVAETKEPASVPAVASPTSRNGAQGLGAADKAKLTLRKPDERKEMAAKNAALTPKTPEAKLVARLISGAKQQLRKTVPLDGPAAAAPESTLHRAPGTLAGSTLATQRQLSAPFKELPRDTSEPAPRLNLPEILSFGQASSRPDTKAGSRKIKWADEGGKNLVQVHEFEVDTITRVTADYRGSKSYRDLVRLERTGAGKVLRHRNEEETEEEAVPMEVQNAAVEQKPAIAWRRPTKLKPAEGVEPCEVVSTELAVQNDRLSAVVEPVFFDDIPDNPAGSLSVEASLETRAPRIPFTAEEAGIDLYVDFAPTKRSFAAVEYSEEEPPSKQARTEAAGASPPASEPDSTQIVSSVPEALRNLHPAMLQLLTDERNLTAILNEDGSVNEQKLQILLDGCRQVQQDFNTQPAQPADVYSLGAPRSGPSGYHDYHSSPPAGDAYGSYPARSPVGYDYRDAPRSMPAAPHRQPMYGQRSAEGRREVDLPPSKVPCKFFGTRTGCKHGDQCRFLHLSGDNRRR